MDQRETIELFGTNKKIIIDKEGVAFINPFNLVKSTDKGTYEDLKRQFNNEKDFRASVLNLDNDYNGKILKNLENKIKKHEDDKSVLPKFLWLKDLLEWNMDPKSSNKFEYLLK